MAKKELKAAVPPSYEAGKKGKSVAEALKEIDFDGLISGATRSINFDAHMMTDIAIQFGEALTGTTPYLYQKDTAYAILYALFTFNTGKLTMLFSRQSGKTETLAFCINTASVLFPSLAKYFPDLEPYSKGVHIGLFAPQSDQVWNTYNRALSQLQSENAEMVMGDPDLEVKLDKPTKYVLTNGSKLVGQVASKQSKIEGATYHWVIIEEAQDVDTYVVRKSIDPMLAATAGTMVKCGTTGTSKDHFWHDIQHNRSQDRKQKDPRLLQHWEFDYLRIIADRREMYMRDPRIKHLFYEKYITQEIARYGKDSQFFQLNYALIWDLESGMLITDKEFNKLCNNKKGHNYEDNDVTFAGLDIGKDVNSTVLTIGRLIWDPNDEEIPPKKEIIHWLEMHGISYEQQHHYIVDALNEFNVTNLYADYTGVGKPVVDRLIAACGDVVNIEPYTFSKQSKSEMWFNLVDDIQSNSLIFPANKTVRQTREWEKFEEQMKNCLKYHDGPYLVCHKADGHMDDYVDSLGLMCLATSFEIQDEIEEEENPLFADQLNMRKLHDQANNYK